MIIFKEKTKKKCDHPVNIDNKHSEILKLFEHQPQMINELKTQLTGDLFQDLETQQKIYELKKQLNPEIVDHPELDEDDECLSCGS